MMDMLSPESGFAAALERNRLYGVYPAQVTNIVDTDGQGRVKVKLPWAPDSGNGGYEVWARLAMLMAGNGRGTWFIPDPNDEVLIAFEGGDARRPYVLGMLWNGQDAPPESMDGAGANNKKTICSRTGIKITFDDTGGSEVLTLQTPGGQKVTLSDAASSIEMQDSNGNDIKMDASGVTITSAADVTIEAGGSMTLTALSLTVNAAQSIFSGSVQGNSVITPSVIGASYTPGAGNIW
jgi:uncharacterized protein involved in type VI secretion and phage assembly